MIDNNDISTQEQELPMDHNTTDLMKEVVDSVAKLERLKGERKSINDEMSSVREGLQAKGLNKKALNMAIQYLKMDEDQRQAFDVGYAFIREALGSPFNAQMDLFEEEKK